MLVVGLALVGYAVSFLALPLGAQQKNNLSTMVFIAMTYIGIAWLFWSGLRDFRPHLKNAYEWICIGYVVTAVGAGLSPIVQAYPELSSTVLFRYGIITPIFFVANMFIFLGVQKFAKVLDVKSVFANFSLVMLAAISVGLFTALLPHVSSEPSELFYILSMACIVGVIIFALSSSYLSFSISRITGTRYSRALFWFGLTMGFIALGDVVTAGVMFTQGVVQGQILSVLAVLFMIPGILVMVSAYKFNKISSLK